MYFVFLMTWKSIWKNVLFRFPKTFIIFFVHISQWKAKLYWLPRFFKISFVHNMNVSKWWKIFHVWVDYTFKLIEGYIYSCRQLTRICTWAYTCLMEENVLKCLHAVALTCVPPPESWTSALGLSHWESGRCRSHDSLQTLLVLGYYPLPKRKDKPQMKPQQT